LLWFPGGLVRRWPRQRNSKLQINKAKIKAKFKHKDV
jgi:hypothetical protein